MATKSQTSFSVFFNFNLLVKKYMRWESILYITILVQRLRTVQQGITIMASLGKLCKIKEQFTAISPQMYNFPISMTPNTLSAGYEKETLQMYNLLNFRTFKRAYVTGWIPTISPTHFERARRKSPRPLPCVSVISPAKTWSMPGFVQERWDDATGTSGGCIECNHGKTTGSLRHKTGIGQLRRNGSIMCSIYSIHRNDICEQCPSCELCFHSCKLRLT